MVVVPDYQLSLAIGKEGQNARLAARLTGWRIDIKSETQHAEELRAPRTATPVTEAAPPEPRVEAVPAPEDETKAEAEPPVQVDKELASVTPRLGRKHDFTSAKAQTVLGWKPRALEDTIVDCANSLLAQGAV